MQMVIYKNEKCYAPAVWFYLGRNDILFLQFKYRIKTVALASISCVFLPEKVNVDIQGITLSNMCSYDCHNTEICIIW